MGKISEALERHEKEGTLGSEAVNSADRQGSFLKGDDLVRGKQMNIGHNIHPMLLTVSSPGSLDAENFKTLRGQIFSSKNGERPRTIMVTSAFPGEGKTFVAANLAVSIAMGIDEHVLLVDCDLRRPSIHQMFGYANAEGLHEYLSKEKALPDLIIKTNIEKLSLLPAGQAAPNPSELLASKSMADFIEEIKHRYDDRFIVIDSTPSQITAEANTLAAHVDGIILVVLAERAPKKTLQRTIENLGREKVLGVVFNGYQQAHKEFQKYYKNQYR